MTAATDIPRGKPIAATLLPLVRRTETLGFRRLHAIPFPLTLVLCNCDELYEFVSQISKPALFLEQVSISAIGVSMKRGSIHEI